MAVFFTFTSPTASLHKDNDSVKTNQLFCCVFLSCRVFGLTNLASLREGKVGRECRGEEHIVEVVRNKTSGKIRIYWNSSEITRYFRQRHFPVDTNNRTVEYSWTTRSDEVLRIVGRVDDNMPDDSIQFDLFIDDLNFKDLCTLAQLGRRVGQKLDQRSPVDETGSQRSLDSSLATNDVDADQNSDLEQGFRLSMVGFNSMTSGEDEINDELHSDLYSNSLTSLRNQIVSCLPQTEEMVSRAIINAFFEEAQNCEPTYSYRSMDEVDCGQIEVDYIYEALCWVRLNVNVAPRVDVADLLLQFLQRCVDNIFLLIRNEQLNSDEAARVVLSVASVLGLEFAVDVASDTIVLERLPPGVTKLDMYQSLSQFGEIEVLSISSKTPTIGFCRYALEDSTAQVTAAFERGDILVNDVKPEVSLVGTLPSMSNPLNVSREGVDFETEAAALPFLMQSPTYYEDFSGECSNSPTTIMANLKSTYEYEDRPSELEIHHPRYCSASTATCY